MNLNQQKINQSQAAAISYGFRQRWADVLVLVKYKLTLTVVITAVLPYLVVSQGAFKWSVLLLLGFGGYLVAGAANALNQILEREYDRNMTRTENRPLAAQRMNISEALVIAGFMMLIGIACLSFIHPLCGLLGMLSLITYSFIYTPLKRFNTLSVAVGAIPGALPVLIGTIAFEGAITPFGLLLFAFQFLWQFPHFWAIGWLSFDQYKKAGFKLLPEKNDQIDPSLGKNTLLYSLLFVGLVVFGWLTGFYPMIPAIFILGLTLWYAWKSFRFFKDFDRVTARKLMFSSFMIMPLIFIILLISSL
jgi:protoheme IX farnesyltransferase